jgi:hypothetical protein
VPILLQKSQLAIRSAHAQITPKISFLAAAVSMAEAKGDYPWPSVAGSGCVVSDPRRDFA